VEEAMPCTSTIAGVEAVVGPSVYRWPYSMLVPPCGLVTGRQTEATCMWLSKTIRGALAGPVTGNLNAWAADEKHASTSPAANATAVDFNDHDID
jgi:hypothetical protein